MISIVCSLIFTEKVLSRGTVLGTKSVIGVDSNHSFQNYLLRMQCLLIAVVLLSLTCTAHSARLPVINAEGVIKSTAAIQSNVYETLSQSEVVNAFSCVGVGEGSEVLRALVDEEVISNEQGT